MNRKPGRFAPAAAWRIPNSKIDSPYCAANIRLPFTQAMAQPALLKSASTISDRNTQWQEETSVGIRHGRRGDALPEQTAGQQRDVLNPYNDEAVIFIFYFRRGT